jgi:two-component system response regulator PilR (NtrC family)
MRILIIDDEKLLRDEIAAILTEHGHHCKCADGGERALTLGPEFKPDIVLSDQTMPGMSGLETIIKLSPLLPECEFIIITAFGTLENSLDAFRQGICDYILKPVCIEDLLDKLASISKRQIHLREVRELRRTINQPTKTVLVGQSPQMENIKTIVKRLSNVSSSVLLTGETGTGKEVVARYIHESSTRCQQPFIAVNCAAIPEPLMESELFGHIKGAFTGATSDKIGVFEAANGGTLLLDEFCEMPFSLQSKLLRVIERREVIPVGKTTATPLDVRLIAATNRTAEEFVKAGKLRADLYYRVNVMELKLPPLRERKEDIPLLCQHFIQMLNQEMKRLIKGVSNNALQAVMLYSWPGNIRELKNAIERAMIFTAGEFLPLENFPVEITRQKIALASPDELKVAIRAYENAHILTVLNKTNGNRAQASKLLKVDRSTLHRKLTAILPDSDPKPE